MTCTCTCAENPASVDPWLQLSKEHCARIMDSRNRIYFKDQFKPTNRANGLEKSVMTAWYVHVLECVVYDALTNVATSIGWLI